MEQEEAKILTYMLPLILILLGIILWDRLTAKPQPQPPKRILLIWDDGVFVNACRARGINMADADFVRELELTIQAMIPIFNRAGQDEIDRYLRINSLPLNPALMKSFWNSYFSSMTKSLNSGR